MNVEEDVSLVEDIIVNQGVQAVDLPVCWSMTVFNNQLAKRPWLLVKNGKLGCKFCSAVGSFHSLQKSGKGKNVNPQWANTNVGFSGKTIEVQQGSLRKKLSEHEHSNAHKMAETMNSNKSTLSDNVLKRKFDESRSYLTEKTSRCFRTAYKAAKHARPFLDFETDVELQQLNGIDMGRILHSDVSCANIISHIASDMKKELLKQCKSSNSKFSILLDESTSLSKRSCLIIYIRSVLPGDNTPNTFFLSLVELDSATAPSIKETLMQELYKVGFNEEYCQMNWLGIATDGCSTMLGKQNGLIALLQKQFPKLVPWHCAAHRLELAVGDALKDVPSCNSFKIFLEKLYSVYSMSPKNQRELREVAEGLEVELIKIGKIFSIRWVASSVRAVKAVWQNFPALFEHFTKAANDVKRSTTEQATFNSLAKHLSSKAFVANLGLMFDTLKELSVVSQELQANTINIMTAHSKLLLTRQLFVSFKERKGKHEDEAEKGNMFKGVPLIDDVRGVRKINRNQFLQSLINMLDERMFTNAAHRGRVCSENKTFYNTIVSNMKVLDKSNWCPEELSDPRFADEKVEQLCNVFRVDEEAVVRSFREYVFAGGNQSNLGEVSQLLQAINLIPVQTAECERGFSAMNRILTPQRASMSIERLEDLLVLYTTGPPLAMFNPEPYVKTWLRKGGHHADDRNAVSKKKKDFIEHPFFKFWNSLGH